MIIKMVTEGIEPSTVALLAQRSNQLSYATFLTSLALPPTYTPAQPLYIFSFSIPIATPSIYDLYRYQFWFRGFNIKLIIQPCQKYNYLYSGKRPQINADSPVSGRNCRPRHSAGPHRSCQIKVLLLEVRPADPIDFVANYLMNKKEAGKAAPE